MNSPERLLVKMEKDFKKILFMILNMQSIYTKYLNKTNKTN